MLENDGYVTAGYRRWLSDIQLLGAPLGSLTSAIATSDTTEGTHSTLLNRLVCARTMSAFAPTTTPACQAQTEDTTAVDTLVSEAMGQLTGTLPGFDGTGKSTPTSPLTTGGATTFDPFVNSASDGSDLSSLWGQLPGRDQVAQCGAAIGTPGPMGAMNRPESVTPNNHGVPQVFQWAHRMGLGTLNVCFTTRVQQVTVDACVYGDGWVAVNRFIPGGCSKSFWDPGPTSANVDGSPTTVTYKYDDIAFVWTFSPQDSASAPVYVQSLVLRGAANAVASPSNAVKSLPRGGYVLGSPQQYSDTAEYIGVATNTSVILYRLHTDARRAPGYSALDTPAKVSSAWGGATKGTPGVSSYQGHNGVINAGDPLDQVIAGLDPKLAPTKAKLDQAVVSVGDDIAGTLVDLQSNVYRGLLRGSQTAGNTSSGPLHDALVRLDGANAMLSSYLQLGASAALRERDLTSLPSSLVGSKGLVNAIKAQLARTVGGGTGTGPGQLVTDMLDADALDDLEGLLPSADSAARGCGGEQPPVHPRSGAPGAPVDQRPDDVDRDRSGRATDGDSAAPAADHHSARDDASASCPGAGPCAGPDADPHGRCPRVVHQRLGLGREGDPTLRGTRHRDRWHGHLHLVATRQAPARPEGQADEERARLRHRGQARRDRRVQVRADCD